MQIPLRSLPGIRSRFRAVGKSGLRDEGEDRAARAHPWDGSGREYEFIVFDLGAVVESDCLIFKVGGNDTLRSNDQGSVSAMLGRRASEGRKRTLESRTSIANFS